MSLHWRSVFTVEKKKMNRLFLETECVNEDMLQHEDNGGVSR